MGRKIRNRYRSYSRVWSSFVTAGALSGSIPRLAFRQDSSMQASPLGTCRVRGALSGTAGRRGRRARSTASLRLELVVLVRNDEAFQQQRRSMPTRRSGPARRSRPPISAPNRRGPRPSCSKARRLPRSPIAPRALLIGLIDLPIHAGANGSKTLAARRPPQSRRAAARAKVQRLRARISAPLSTARPRRIGSSVALEAPPTTSGITPHCYTSERKAGKSLAEIAAGRPGHSEPGDLISDRHEGRAARSDGPVKRRREHRGSPMIEAAAGSGPAYPPRGRRRRPPQHGPGRGVG